ncbi:MAG: hypothetical protein ABIU05_11845 [Nitrospirales bacterium]
MTLELSDKEVTVLKVLTDQMLWDTDLMKKIFANEEDVTLLRGIASRVRAFYEANDENRREG